MSLFERLGKVFLDELTCILSSSVSPEEEIERYISQKRSTAMAINIAIGKVPAKQAKILRKQLADLKLELSEAEAKRDALLRRQNRANNGLQLATGFVKNPFERMEEKVREAEEVYQAASTLNEQQSVSKADLEQRFARLETDSGKDNAFIHVNTPSVLELVGSDLEKQLALLDSGSDADEEVYFEG